MTTILIPDYPGQQVIAGIKSLHEDGDTCDLAWNIKSYDYLFKSNHIRNYYKIPAAQEGADDFAESLITLLKEHTYDMVLPFGNDANHAVNRAQDEIRKYTKVLTPSKQAHEIAYDKEATFDHCKKVGIDCPATFSDYNEADLLAIANDLKYPAVIKARSGSGVKSGLRYANNQRELLEKYHEISQLIIENNREGYANPIIQEFIPGYVHDACVLFENGKALVVLTQIRHLMYPIYGGVGAINYTTHNKELADVAVRLIESLDWTGPAEVEFKYDERDGKYKLIEINPKLWGTLDLSIQSGVSFPKLIRDLLMGKPVTQPEYQSGNCYYFLFPQTSLAALQSISKFKGKNLSVKNIDIKKKFNDVDWGDPKPLLGRILQTIFKVISGKIANETRNLPIELINH